MTPRITVNHKRTAELTDEESDEDESGSEGIEHGFSPGEDSDDSDEDYVLEETEESEEDDLSHDNSWSDLGIGPSQSASRTRSNLEAREASSHRYPPARSAPRAKTARKYTAVPELPSGAAPRRGRRAPQREASRPRSMVDEPADDYPYDRYAHHPHAQWGNVGLYPGGHPGSTLSAYDSGSMQYYGRDIGSGNPFAAPPTNGYFDAPRNRNSMGPRAAGNEMMPYGHPGASPFGYPGFSPYAYPYAAPPMATPGPPPRRPTPGAAEAMAAAAPGDPTIKLIQEMLEKQQKETEAAKAAALKEKADAAVAAANAKAVAEADKLEALTKLIKKHNEEQLEREKKMEAKHQKEKEEREAMEKAAVEAKKAQEEKTKELKAAGEAAKKAAEEEAAKKAAEAKEKWDKEMEEQKKKTAELEEGKKKAEEEAKALRPTDDMKKPPIKFKDAVGRKFSFPWHLCKTWKGMQILINQAFLHVEGIGQHVHDGHYDLIGPDGEIILPQVWETMVKPDWSISMHMWPLPEPARAVGHADMVLLGPGDHGHGRNKEKDRKGSKEKKSRKVIAVPPPPTMPMMPPPPPVPMFAGVGPPPPVPLNLPGPPPNLSQMAIPIPFGASQVAEAVPEKKRDKDKEKKKKKASSGGGMASWFAGGGGSVARKESLKSGKKPESDLFEKEKGRGGDEEDDEDGEVVKVEVLYGSDDVDSGGPVTVRTKTSSTVKKANNKLKSKEKGVKAEEKVNKRSSAVPNTKPSSSSSSSTAKVNKEKNNKVKVKVRDAPSAPNGKPLLAMRSASVTVVDNTHDKPVDDSSIATNSERKTSSSSSTSVAHKPSAPNGKAPMETADCVLM